MKLKSAAVSIVELVGLAAVVAGLWLVFAPVALVIAGLGALLWAQGVARGERQ